MSNFGRQKAPWTQADWSEIDRAVKDQADAIRVARKFLSPTPLDSDLDSVPLKQVVRVVGTPTRITPGLRLTPIEIENEFELDPQQIGNISDVTRLAEDAAREIARAEDEIIFNGMAAVAAASVRGANPGYRGLADGANRIINNNEPLYETVQSGIASLEADRHYGPYALILRPDIYRQANTKDVSGERAIHQLENLMNMKIPILQSTILQPADPNIRDPGIPALLISLDANSVDIAVTQEITTGIVRHDVDLNLRVFERFALRINDPSVILTLVPAGVASLSQVVNTLVQNQNQFQDSIARSMDRMAEVLERLEKKDNGQGE